MPAVTAHRLCPHGVFLPPRIDYYAEVSGQIREIFERFTPLVEPLSLDEAFLDVTGSEHLFGPAVEIGRQIKQAIREELRLVASVGVAPNKFLAKIASDLKKPDALVVVEPDKVQEFLDPLPVERLWGVGKQSSKVFQRLGIRTIGQLRQWPLDALQSPLRQQRRAPVAIGPRPRRPAGGARAGGEVDLPRDDVRARHRRPGGAAGLAGGPDRAGRLPAAAAWAAGPDGAAQGPLCRLLLDHPLPNAARAHGHHARIVAGGRRAALPSAPGRAPAGAAAGHGRQRPGRHGNGPGMLFDEEERKKQTRLDAVADQVKERFGVESLRRGSSLERGEKHDS